MRARTVGDNALQIEGPIEVKDCTEPERLYQDQLERKIRCFTKWCNYIPFFWHFTL